VTLLLATALLVLPPPGRAAQKTWTLESVLRQLDHEAGAFRTMTADIERTKVTVVVNDHSTESGRIWVRRDDKMRIDITSPDPRTILRDGDRLYLYNPKIRRVEEYDLGKHRALVDQLVLLGFGTSGKELQKGYLVTFRGEEMLDGQKTVHLELTPKSGQVRNQIDRIELWVDEGTWLPARQVFYETGTGDYFIIRYMNVARNVPVADSRFKPRWPSGVTKVKPQG
jgi:outer membrane lipoprotein carrier protein